VVDVEMGHSIPYLLLKSIDINLTSPAPSTHSPLDITADINPQFFPYLAIAGLVRNPG